MSRGRLLPSLVSRSKNQIDMALPNGVLRDMVSVQVYGASNVNDAYSNPSLLFEVPVGRSFISPSLRSTRSRGQEDSKRDQTRFLFNLDDYATVPQGGVTRIPPDHQVAYIRVRGALRNGGFTHMGPVTAVVPYDFFGVPTPVFTFMANAPDLDTNGVIPDVLDEGAMNVHLPMFSQTVFVKNFSEVQGGSNLFFTLSSGMSPTMLRPGESLGLTGVTTPEFYFASDGGTPLFSVACGIVNKG